MGFYCEKLVNKGRKDKECDFCGEDIPVGEAHMVFPDAYMESNYAIHLDCHKWLNKKEYSPTSSGRGGELDDYTENKEKYLEEYLKEKEGK